MTDGPTTFACRVRHPLSVLLASLSEASRISAHRRRGLASFVSVRAHAGNLGALGPRQKLSGRAGRYCRPSVSMQPLRKSIGKRAWLDATGSGKCWERRAVTKLARLARTPDDPRGQLAAIYRWIHRPFNTSERKPARAPLNVAMHLEAESGDALGSAQRFDRPPRCRVEAGAACIEMREDRLAHARVPELGDVLGDLRGRCLHILCFEKPSDLVSHIDQLVWCGFTMRKVLM